MGKGNDASSKSQEMMAESFKDMSSLNREMQTGAKPWREAAGASYMEGLKNPAAFAAPGINEISRGTSSNMSSAKEMQGGNRDQTMRNLKMNDITSKAQLLNQGKMAATQGLGNLGLGQSQTGISAMGQANSAAGNLGQMGSAQSSAKAQGMQGFGSMLGGL